MMELLQVSEQGNLSMSKGPVPQNGSVAGSQ